MSGQGTALKTLAFIGEAVGKELFEKDGLAAMEMITKVRCGPRPHPVASPRSFVAC
jgi:hypothetical protein